MAESGAPSARLVTCVKRARAIALTHPCVDRADNPVANGGSMQLEVWVGVPMPNSWVAKGVSPSGVKRFEPVRLEFPPEYPTDPPEVSLRPDFRRDIAHIQPWLTWDERPVPCVQDGRMSEFMHRQGIAGILNQTVLWLERAAEGRLINPDQGWEPLRRDDVGDLLVADADTLRSVVSRGGGLRFQQLQYFRRKSSWLIGQVLGDQLALNKKTVQDAVHNESNGDKYHSGRSVVLIAWPGKNPSGQPIICDKYVPDTVKNLGGLKEKARAFGCQQHLNSGLGRIKECVKDCRPAGPFPLAVVLCARRPCNMIGSSSPIELCSYVLDFHAGDAFPEGEETPVRPAAHRDQITAALLARLSGLAADQNRPPWTLIGAGSLGSKIALHMSRSGCGPVVIVDSGMMAPHNAARHAIIPYRSDMQIMWIDMKARQLSQALAGLSQVSTAVTEDVAHVIDTRTLAKQAWSKQTWAIVNTTASLRVRAALCAQPLPQRVIEALLYAEGKLGLIATEGPERNPDIGDLIAEFYSLGVADAGIAPLLYPDDDENELVRVTVGEGCGSTTMQVSDGKISMYAAGVSEYLLMRQDQGLPDQGELFIGNLTPTGLGVTWNQHSVAPVTVITAENSGRWKVRINARAAEQIDEEVRRWPGVETGGVLLGRHDEATESLCVVEVLPPPEDSVRSSSEFTLGTKGLRRALEDYMRSTNVSLYCLGTWHSHLTESGPSQLDKQTAHAMGLSRLPPSALLIRTPKGYRAVLSETATAGSSKG